MVQSGTRIWLSHPGSETPDIFVHMETLRRSGFTELRPAQVVLVRYGRGPHGLMAADIKPDKILLGNDLQTLISERSPSRVRGPRRRVIMEG